MRLSSGRIHQFGNRFEIAEDPEKCSGWNAQSVSVRCSHGCFEIAPSDPELEPSQGTLVPSCCDRRASPDRDNPRRASRVPDPSELEDGRVYAQHDYHPQLWDDRPRGRRQRALGTVLISSRYLSDRAQASARMQIGEPLHGFPPLCDCVPRACNGRGAGDLTGRLRVAGRVQSAQLLGAC